MRTIHLPKYVTVRQLPAVMEFIVSLHADSSSALDINCAQFEFVDPLGLCLLQYHLDTISRVSSQVNLKCLSGNLAAYLNRMDFFAGLDNVYCENAPQKSRWAEIDHGFVALTKLVTNSNIDKIAGKLARTMAGASSVSCEADPDGMRASPADRLHTALQYVLSELINNAASHGKMRGYPYSEIWVAAQYYKGGNVRLAIVDNGCGFLESLRGHPGLHHETHRHAILTALQPRISCNRDLTRGLDSGNQGIGLTASKTLTMAASGRIDIFSGNAWYRETLAGAHSEDLLFPWQGVGISLTMNRSLLQELEIARIIQSIAPLRESRDFNFVE